MNENTEALNPFGNGQSEEGERDIQSLSDALERESRRFPRRFGEWEA